MKWQNVYWLAFAWRKVDLFQKTLSQDIWYLHFASLRDNFHVFETDKTTTKYLTLTTTAFQLKLSRNVQPTLCFTQDTSALASASPSQPLCTIVLLSNKRKRNHHHEGNEKMLNFGFLFSFIKITFLPNLYIYLIFSLTFCCDLGFNFINFG